MVRSFSSDLLMMRSSSCGTSGLMRTGATGARFRMASKTAAEVEPENACRPVAISYNTTPSEKISVRESRSLPSVCSGDMYATVPTAMPGLVRLASSSVAVPEVVWPSLPGVRQKNIRGLDVAMDDAFRMRGVQRIGGLDAGFEQGIERHRPAGDAML